MFSQSLNTHRVFKRRAKALIRLRVCAGWSEPLLVAHNTLLEISFCGSYIEESYGVEFHLYLSRDIRLPTMRNERPAKAQTRFRIFADRPEPLLVA